MKPSERSAVLLALGGFAIVACQVVAGIERVEKDRQGDALDASTVDSGEDGTSGDPCNHVRPPPVPETDDDRDLNVPPFYLALHTIKLVPDASDAYQGFDLDGVCTCDKRPASALAGASSCAPKNSDCDSDGGVDNAGVSLFTTFTRAGFSADTSANKNIDEGRRGLLLYITNYNGKSNDREVKIGAMVTHGILDETGCGTVVEDGRARPGWCGRDRWTYPISYVRLDSKEPTFQATGWVNNGELVFNAAAQEMKIFLGGTILTLGSPIAAGRLEKAKSSSGADLWRLSGVLAGRIPVTELLAATGSIGNGKDGGGACNDPLLFDALVKPTLCKAVDISHTSRFDFTTLPSGASAACNAISTAIQFTADEASIGEEHSETDEDGPCSLMNAGESKYKCPP